MFKLLERIVVAGQSLLIIAWDVEDGALEFLVLNRQRRGLNVVAVQAPENGDRRHAKLEEVATFTGGMVVNKRLGISLRDFSTISDRMMGRAKKVRVEKHRTTIVGGIGQLVSRAATASERQTVPQARTRLTIPKPAEPEPISLM